MAHPIWKDYYVTLASSVSTGVAFRIRLYRDGAYTTIYTGTCWPRPDSTDAIVKINDICADYLLRAFPNPVGAADYYDSSFIVQAYISGDWTTIASPVMARDWSFDSSFTPGTDIPLDPVTTVLNPSQYLPLFSDDGTFTASIVGGDFNIDFNQDFSAVDWYISLGSDGITYLLDLSQYSGWETITANGMTYTAGSLCGGYVLYYINAYGGWDSLPVQGRTVRSEDITRHNIEVVYDNSTYLARGRENYVNEIEHKYRLNIGPLTSSQSEKMHNLFGSTYVYLHDLDNGRIHPVVLTATSHEVKNRHGALHFYEVEATLAQDRTRR